MTDNSHVEEKVYCFWTDDNPITPNRQKGLETMRENLGVPICFLDKKGIEERILPEAPLHPAYKYLSAVHKSDYLRCYFMHHFGGGYADIKPYSRYNNWKRCFDYINKFPEVEIVGSHEVPNGAALLENRNPIDTEKLLCTSFFICKPHTEFTQEWYSLLLSKMEEKKEELQKNPALSPFGGERYPLRWAELLGEIYHSLLLAIDTRNPRAKKNSLITGWDYGVSSTYR